MATASFSLCQGDPSTWGVPAAGKTFVGVNAAGQLVTKQNDGTITVLVTGAPELISATNASGATTFTLADAVASGVLTVQGAARTVPIYLDTAGAEEGSVINLLVKFPAAANYVFVIRNEDGSGDVLATFTSFDDSIASLKYQFVFADGAWTLFGAQIPAY